jgi:hypothetical protein
VSRVLLFSGDSATGRVTTEATIANLHDLVDAKLGRLSGEQVRLMTVPDALVDSEATSVGLPMRFIDRPGLPKQ